MDTAKHTPGPWEFAEWNAGVNNTPGFGLIAKCGGPDVTIHTRTLDGNGYVDCTERAMANARLIAAAPDLLAALQTLNLVVGLTPIAGNKGALQEACDMARAAIAKAEGGAQ